MDAGRSGFRPGMERPDDPHDDIKNGPGLRIVPNNPGKSKATVYIRGDDGVAWLRCHGKFTVEA